MRLWEGIDENILIMMLIVFVVLLLLWIPLL